MLYSGNHIPMRNVPDRHFRSAPNCQYTYPPLIHYDSVYPLGEGMIKIVIDIIKVYFIVVYIMYTWVCVCVYNRY